MSDFTICNRCGTKIHQHWRHGVRHALACGPCESFLEKASPRFKEYNHLARSAVKWFDRWRREHPDEPPPERALKALVDIYTVLREEVRRHPTSSP